MVLLETADNAVTAAAVIAERTPETLSSTALELYQALVAVAIETAKARDHAPNTTEVVLHMPLEQVAKAVGLHRTTVWRNLPALQHLGLVDYRPHKASCRGETRNSGCVWRVRLTPDRGSKARLRRLDMKHPWRDLDSDVKRGRTSYRALKENVQHTKDSPLKGFDLQRLLGWTLPRKLTKTPLQPVCCTSRQATLETLLDVSAAPKPERSEMVELAAQALSQALSDQNSVSWYQKLLWQLLRRFDATGDDHSYQVYLVAQRARTDSLEGFAWRPGALFTSRLKQAPWFDEVMRGPPVRVSTYRADLHSRSDLRQAAALKPLPVVVGVRVDRQGALPA